MNSGTNFCLLNRCLYKLEYFELFYVTCAWGVWSQTEARIFLLLNGHPVSSTPRLQFRSSSSDSKFTLCSGALALILRVSDYTPLRISALRDLEIHSIVYPRVLLLLWRRHTSLCGFQCGILGFGTVQSSRKSSNVPRSRLGVAIHIVMYGLSPYRNIE